MVTLQAFLLLSVAHYATCAIVKVAVYEHVVMSPTTADGNFTREEAFDWMLRNLEVTRQQAQIASGKVGVI